MTSKNEHVKERIIIDSTFRLQLGDCDTLNHTECMRISGGGQLVQFGPCCLDSSWSTAVMRPESIGNSDLELP